MSFDRPRRRPALSDERRTKYGLQPPRRRATNPADAVTQSSVRNASALKQQPSDKPSGSLAVEPAPEPRVSRRHAPKAAAATAVAPQRHFTPQAPAATSDDLPVSRSQIWSDEFLEESTPPYYVRPPFLALVILILALVGGLGVYFAADAMFGQATDKPDQSEPVLSQPTTIPTPPPATVSPLPTAAATPAPAPEPQPTVLPVAPVPPPVPVDGPTMAYVDVSGALRVSSTGSGDRVVATEAQHPEWSPDGSRLAFVRQSDGMHEIWISEAASGATTRVLGPVSEQLRGPIWHPDGRALLYHEQSGGNETGRIMRIVPGESSSPEVVLEPSGLSLNWEGYDTIVHAFDITPDGRLVFQASVGRPGAVYADACGLMITNPDGGASQITSLQRGACHGLPSVSPDGQQVGFISYPGDGAGYLSVINIDGTGFQHLRTVRLRGVSSNPFWPRIAWSSDSQNLLYESVEGGDAIFTQYVNDPAGLTRQLWGYGRHPATP